MNRDITSRLVAHAATAAERQQEDARKKQQQKMLEEYLLQARDENVRDVTATLIERITEANSRLRGDLIQFVPDPAGGRGIITWSERQIVFAFDEPGTTLPSVILRAWLTESDADISQLRAPADLTLSLRAQADSQNLPATQWMQLANSGSIALSEHPADAMLALFLQNQRPSKRRI